MHKHKNNGLEGNETMEIPLNHWRVRLYADAGPMLEKQFVDNDDVVIWVNGRSPEQFPFIEIEEMSEKGQWELKQTWNRTKPH